MWSISIKSMWVANQPILEIQLKDLFNVFYLWIVLKWVICKSTAWGNYIYSFDSQTGLKCSSWPLEWWAVLALVFVNHSTCCWWAIWLARWWTRHSMDLNTSTWLIPTTLRKLNIVHWNATVWLRFFTFNALFVSGLSKLATTSQLPENCFKDHITINVINLSLYG